MLPGLVAGLITILGSSVGLSGSSVLAAPESFDPSRREVPQLESFESSFLSDRDNFGKDTSGSVATWRWRYPRDRTVTASIGLMRYGQAEAPTQFVIPISLTRAGQREALNWQLSAGLTFYDRLTPALSLAAVASHPLSETVAWTGRLEWAPYAVSAAALTSQIQALRTTHTVYWQIRPQSFGLAVLTRGWQSDGNREWQLYSRLEHTQPRWFIAANLFAWRFDRDQLDASGYFSPPDFLSYSAELGWTPQISDSISCRIAYNFGRTRLEGVFSTDDRLSARCTTPFAERWAVALEAVLTPILTQGGDYRNQRLQVQLTYR